MSIVVPQDACLAHLLPVVPNSDIPVLHLKTPITKIGRVDTDNDIALDSNVFPLVVSRKHCTIQKRDNEWLMIDSSSDRVMIGGAANVSYGTRTSPLTDLAFVFQVAGQPFVPDSAALVPPPVAPVGLAEKRKARDGDDKSNDNNPNKEAKSKDEKSAEKKEEKEEKEEKERKAARKDEAKKKKKQEDTGVVAEEESEEEEEQEEIEEHKSGEGSGRRSSKRTTASKSDKALALILASAPAKRRAAQRWAKGAEVEAKCQNTAVPEVNAWFRANIIDHRGAKYRIRYLDDDGKPYEASLDEWLPPICIREPSIDYEPIKAKVGSLLSVRQTKTGWYYDARITQIHHTNKSSSEPMFTVDFEDKAVMGFRPMAVKFDDTFWVCEQSAERTPSVAPAQKADSDDDSE